MEIRFSPYNSPFVPLGPSGVLWIGAEYRHALHSGHVIERQRYLGAQHVQHIAHKKFMDRELQKLNEEFEQHRAAVQHAPKKKISARGYLAKRSIADQKNRTV